VAFSSAIYFILISMVDRSGFGHPFSPAGDPLDPASAPSRLRHSHPQFTLF
jgi:hypothetical protein